MNTPDTQPAETIRIGMPTHEALALLPIPAHFSDPQRDGHACVYCSEALARGTDVDLGSRTVDGGLVSPHSCRTCVSHVATGALFDHATACKNCKTNGKDEDEDNPMCPVARALYRVVRLGRR